MIINLKMILKVIRKINTHEIKNERHIVTKINYINFII